MGTLTLAASPADWSALPLDTRFSDLYQRHADLVYRAALRVTGNAADAEDVLQSVFLRLLHDTDRLDPHRSPESYLRRAATNAAIDVLRRKSSRGEYQLDTDLPHAAPDSQPLLKERLRRAIAQLPPRDAELFSLRYLEGLSNGDLADLFEMEKTTVAVRLHRIRQTLQQEMER